VKKFKDFAVKGTISTALLSIGFIAGISSPLAGASSDSKAVNLQVDGKRLAGQVVEGTTMVSARAVGEALGRNVSWNQQDNTVVIESRLDTILKRGYIRVGTTGDYKPFTYLNPQTNQYEGYDIEAATKLAKDLGVEVKFVKTSWKTLMSDLLADKFDIAMGGISRDLQREKTASLTHPYIQFGKSPLVRAADKDKFKSLEDIDQPSVKIAVNPGGTNEKFVKEHIKNAQVTVVENNLEIPKLIADGKYDVMITDNIEAELSAKQNPLLYAALTDNTFTKDEKGYLLNRGDASFENWVNLWMEQMVLKGQFNELQKKWIN
jgi:cyclohexadienyl dehydratase